MVQRSVLEAQGLTDLPTGARLWAMDTAKVEPEKQALLRELAGPQHRVEREGKWATLAEQRDNRAPVQKAAAEKVGVPSDDARSADRRGIRETGIQVFVLKSESAEFKGMMVEGGHGKAHDYNPQTGERKVAAELPAQAPELMAKLNERFGENRREAWATQPEVIALGERAKAQGEGKRAVRATAAAYVSSFADPSPLRVADSDKAKELVSRELAKLTPEQIAIKVYASEATVARYAPEHARSAAFEKTAGYATVSENAKLQQSIVSRGADFGRAELAARGADYPYDVSKGIKPSAADIAAAFPNAKAPAKGAERSGQAPQAETKTETSAPAKGKDPVAGGSRRRSAAPAR